MTAITYCINTETGDVSEWDRVYTRIWNVNGVYYGFSDLGIFELTGKKDDLKAIKCSLTTVPNDNDTEALKRVPYTRVECTGSTDITLMLDRVPVSTVNMAATDNRAKFARGAKGRFVSYKVESSDPDFTLIEISPNVETQKRGFK
jgi:hypothetical protein